MINPGYYNQIFQLSPVAGVILLPDPATFTIVDVNDAFLKVTGSEREDLVGKNFMDVIKLKPGIYSNEKALLLSLCKASNIITHADNSTVGNERSRDTAFVGNHWHGENKPLLKQDNTIEYILHSITETAVSYCEFEFEELQEAEVEMLVASAENRTSGRKAINFPTGDLMRDFDFSTAIGNGDIYANTEMNKIMRYSPDVICTIDEMGRFVQVSDAAKKIWGYEPAELSGRSYLELVAPADLDLTKKAGLEIISGQVITNFENRCIHKDGSLVPIIWSARWDNDDKVMYCVAKDATDKKKVELEKSLFIFNTDESFILVDPELNIVEFNYQFKYLYQKCLGKDIKKGDNILDYAQPERREKSYQLYQRVLKGTEEKSEINLPFEGNSRKIFVLNYKPAVNEYGEIIGVFVTAKDVTDIVSAKKQLEASEEKYRLLFHKSPIAKWVYELDTLQILDVNETAITQYGYSREEFLSMTVNDIKPKEELVRMKTVRQSIREGKGLMHFGVFTQLKKDGTKIKADVSGVKLTFMNRDCMVIESIDVTEKEKVMQKLQDNEVKLLSAQKIARLGYWQLLPDMQLLYWSAEVYNIWGVSKETFKVSRDTFLQTMHPDDVKAFQEEMEAVFAGEKDHDFTHRIILPGGSIKWVHEKGKLVTDDDGKIILFEGTVQDITESREAHEKLLISEARHRGIVDSQTSYVIRTDLQGRYTYGNNKYKNDFGWIYDNNDLIGEDSLRTVKPYHQARLMETVTKCFENLNKVFQVELDKPQRDGGAITTLWDFICLTDSTGKPTEMQCVGIDISDRKKAEEALKESNERYEYVSKATSDAIWDCDIETNTTFRSEGFHTLFGYDPAEVDNGKTPWTDYIHPDDKDRVIKKLEVFIAGQKTKWKDEYRYLKADGVYAFVLDKGFAIRSKEGKALKMVGAMQDITERKMLQHLLDKSNRLARIGSWEIDVLKGSVFWSSVTKEIREAEPDFAPDLSLGIHYFKAGKDRETIAARVKECMEHGTPWDDELQIITQKGNLKWIRTIGEAEIVNGKCIKIYGSFQDIDEKKRTELELLKLYAEKNTILESIGDGFFTVDNDWIVTYWNAQAEKMLRKSKSEVVGKNLWQVFKERKGSHFYNVYHTAIETRRVQHSEDYDERLDRWYEASAYPSGNGLSVYFKDITDRKKAQEAINLSNERYTIVSMATNDSIWDWDLVKNEVFRPGKTLESLFGYGSIEPAQVDAFWKSHVDAEDWKRVTRNRNKLLQSPDQNYWEDEYRFLKADGSLAYVYDRGYIMRNEEGKPVRMIGASQDISKLKENEIQLKELNEQLKKWTKELATSNAELEQFAYVASHDLQEPLRMITGFLTQLEKKYGATLDEKGKQYIHFATDGASRMRQIMRDLLEYSRVGRAAQMVEKVDLDELVKEVLGLHRKQIKERKAVIKTDKLPVVIASKTPMRQVFLNLISNSLKYHNGNERTKIHISCKSSDMQWEFAVTDNGIGIDPKDFERIFIIFQRLHSKEEYSGTGMGLTITKKIIETLGGKIWVTSEAGKGTTFYFTIPKNERPYSKNKNQKRKVSNDKE